VGHIGGGSSKFYNWPTRPWYPPAVLRLQGYTQFKHKSEISHPRMAPVGHTRQRNGVAFLADTPIRTQHDRCIGTIEREIASAAVFRQDESMARGACASDSYVAARTPTRVRSHTGYLMHVILLSHIFAHCHASSHSPTAPLPSPHIVSRSHWLVLHHLLITVNE
jgi:hypothetical protein